MNFIVTEQIIKSKNGFPQKLHWHPFMYPYSHGVSNYARSSLITLGTLKIFTVSMASPNVLLDFRC